MKKYALPSFLAGVVAPAEYEKWLRRKAQTHVRRDRARGNGQVTPEAYRNAIHRAVVESAGVDAYTEERLDWSLISKYDNDQSQASGRQYKHTFALLPTVDHVDDGKGAPDFRICGWRTNDAKHDLSLPDFLGLCRRILERHGFSVKEPAHPGSSATSSPDTTEE